MENFVFFKITELGLCKTQFFREGMVDSMFYLSVLWSRIVKPKFGKMQIKRRFAAWSVSLHIQQEVCVNIGINKGKMDKEM